MDATGKRLLILGANRYNVMGIRAAKNAGFTALVADRNPRAPGLNEADIPLKVDLIDIEGLAAAVDRMGGVDGCVSMAEAGVRTAAALARRFGLSSISEEAAANATSKAKMRQRWASAGRWSGPFAAVMSAAEALSAAASASSASRYRAKGRSRLSRCQRRANVSRSDAAAGSNSTGRR